MWAESERRYFARRSEENRGAWCEHHLRLQSLHADLAKEHREKAKALLETQERKKKSA
jgi:hypothetical protein